MTPEITRYAEQLGQCLIRDNAKVTTAESCTGGGIAYAITSVAGSSKWFEQAFISYSNSAKQQLLGVPGNLLDEHGAVSGPVVTAMATGALVNAQADLAVAVSGIAGPDGGTDEKPVGTVWFAWQFKEQRVVRKHQFNGDRETVRLATIAVALAGLLEILQN